jgi:ABC-2 type transport system permease protein
MVTPDTLQYLLKDLFENITVFSNRVNAAPNKEEELCKALVMQHVKITKKDNTFTYRTKEMTNKVGIDSYNYLVNRISNNNVKALN